MDAARPELDWSVAPDDVSTKLGLWGGVMHNEERDTKSFGGSGSSGGRRESQESEAGVRGLGLQGFGLLLLRKSAWPQELMHTRASAASRSVYSRPLETDCSLSCLLLFTEDPQRSMYSVPWESISVNFRDGIEE